MSFSTAKAPPAGSATLATWDSSTSRVEVLRAMRRANASGRPSRASNGSTVTASAPPTPAANAATQVRSMFTHGSYLVIIGREVTACRVMFRRSSDGAAQLQHPRPQAAYGAQLGDRQELLVTRREPELDQPGGLVDRDPGGVEGAQVVGAERQHVAELLHVGGAEVVHGRPVDDQCPATELLRDLRRLGDDCRFGG